MVVCVLGKALMSHHLFSTSTVLRTVWVKCIREHECD